MEIRFPKGLWLALGLLQDWWLTLPLFALGLETHNDLVGDLVKTAIAYLLIMAVVISLFRWPRVFVFEGGYLEARRGLLGTARTESLVMQDSLTVGVEQRSRNRVAIVASTSDGSSVRLVTYFVLTRRNVDAVVEVAARLGAAIGPAGA